AAPVTRSSPFSWCRVRKWRWPTGRTSARHSPEEGSDVGEGPDDPFAAARQAFFKDGHEGTHGEHDAAYASRPSLLDRCTRVLARAWQRIGTPRHHFEG